MRIGIESILTTCKGKNGVAIAANYRVIIIDGLCFCLLL